MALDIKEQVAEALADVLQGGWARYLELEDGSTVRTQWLDGENGKALQITNAETGHQLTLAVKVTCDFYPMTPVGPEGDGALRDELAAVESAVVVTTWGGLCEGDQAIGEDGQPYLVERVREGIGPQAGKTVVTMIIGGQTRPYPMDPAGPVKVIRGAAGRAAQALLDGGLGAETVRSA